VSRRVAREIQIFVADCRSTSRELHIALEGVGQTDNYKWHWRGLDGQLNMALEGVGRRTDKHGSGGGWTDGQLHMALEGVGRTDGQLNMALERVGRRTDN
jgi:hypothetical protein